MINLSSYLAGRVVVVTCVGAAIGRISSMPLERQGFTFMAIAEAAFAIDGGISL